MNRKVLVLIGLVLVLLILLLPALFQPQGLQSAPARTSTPSHFLTPGGPAPVAQPQDVIKPSQSQVRDLAPNVSLSDKDQIIVRHSNGEYEWFLVPRGMKFDQSLLGPGDIIQGILPAPSGQIPPQASPPPLGSFPQRPPGTPSTTPPAIHSP